MVIGLVLSVSFVSYSFVLSGEQSAQRAQTSFKGPTVRENAHALADIYRLQFSLERAVSDGGFNGETRDDYLAALDYLYVRAVNFARNLVVVPYREDSAAALAAINSMIKLSDEAAALGFPDLDGFSGELNAAAQTAQASLIHYMNALHVDTQAALSGTVQSLGNLTRLHSAFLLVMLAFAIAMLTLLRREVLNRHQWSEAEARVSFLAYHDDLTGLGNRATFSRRGAEFFDVQTGGKNQRGALAFIDLDDFKEINDVYGHPAGDAVLRHVAAALREVSAEHGAIPVRIAGDEFAVLLDSGKPSEIRSFVANLLAKVSRPIAVQDNVLSAQLSVGIAAAQEVAKTTKVTLETMSRSADYALYAAKRMVGRGNVQMFDEALSTQWTHRRSRLTAMEGALKKREFEVALQPQIDLKTFALSGFEALARWTHEGEVVSPDEFISLAEESGLIIELDCFMLDQATRFMASWNQLHGTQIPISVNISAVHVSSSKLVATISKALATSGLEPHLLTIELTETVEVRDWKIVVDRLARIRDLGCRLSIDDFGSGYSSLGYLRKMPAHELKIDRSLVIGIENSPEVQSIVSAVVDIAHSLDFVTVVEGIETLEQARVARHLGCTHAQGYLFSRPLLLPQIPAPSGVFPIKVLDELRACDRAPGGLLEDNRPQDGAPQDTRSRAAGAR